MLSINELIGFGVGGESGKHTRWRIFFTGPATSYYGHAQAAEIEMRATIGGADQCNGGAAIASGYVSPYTPDKAFNNSVASIYDNWGSGAAATGGWIGYVFPAPVQVAEFYFYPSNVVSPSWPTAFALEYSDDGLVWSRVKEYTGLTWSSNTPQTFTV